MRCPLKRPIKPLPILSIWTVDLILRAETFPPRPVTAKWQVTPDQFSACYMFVNKSVFPPQTIHLPGPSKSGDFWTPRLTSKRRCTNTLRKVLVWNSYIDPTYDPNVPPDSPQSVRYIVQSGGNRLTMTKCHVGLLNVILGNKHDIWQ